MKQSKPKVVRVIGLIPTWGHGGGFWKVRMVAPNFPFFIDSRLSFRSKDNADAFAERWKRRKVVITVTDPTASKSKKRARR